MSQPLTPRPRTPKLIGSDVELGNMIWGRASATGTGADAARLLLRQIDAVSSPSHPATGNQRVDASHWGDGTYTGWSSGGTHQQASGPSQYNPQDWGRKYLSTNGGCVYIDLNHLEICTPEVTSARDFIAASRSMLCMIQDAMHAANAGLPPGQRVVVLANNSDGQGNSYGSHLNFLITRELWSRLFDRLYPDLFVLCSFQASSIVLTGQGKVGAENGQRPIDYQISQRADFIETVTGLQTTSHRPLVNSRDEPHCGRWVEGHPGSSVGDKLARLHCIFYDNTLSQVSSFLKVGMMQIVLAMMEAGQVDAGLILEDPVAALHAWSRDPDLGTLVPLGDGRGVTAVELQRAFLESAKSFMRSAGGREYVPEAEMILDLWDDTLAKLEARAFKELCPRLDWVLKRHIIEGTLRNRPQLSWNSPEIKHLDLLYSSLDEEDGLFWACERSGSTERIVSEGLIERFVHHPPDDTRAWTRAMMLRAIEPEHIAYVNWDEIRVRLRNNRWGGSDTRSVLLHNPLRFTKTDSERLFRQTGLSDPSRSWRWRTTGKDDANLSDGGSA